MKNVLILERSSQNLKNVGQKGKTILEGVFAEFGVENRNGRVYEEKEYLPHLEYLKQDIQLGSLLGELDHPDRFEVALGNVSHRIIDLWYDQANRQVKGRIEILEGTPKGQVAKSLLEAGVPLSISSRAAGTVNDDKTVSIQQIYTYDLVAKPGFEKAQLETVNESLRARVSNQIQMINESYDRFEKSHENLTNKLGILNERVSIYDLSDKLPAPKLREEAKQLVKNKSEQSMKVNEESVQQWTVYFKNELSKTQKRLAAIENAISEGNVSAKEIKSLRESLKKVKSLQEQHQKWTGQIAKNINKVAMHSKTLAEKSNQHYQMTKKISETVDYNAKVLNHTQDWVGNNAKITNAIAETVDHNAKMLNGINEWNTELAKGVNALHEWGVEKAEAINDLHEWASTIAKGVNTTASWSQDMFGRALSKDEAKKLVEYIEFVAEARSNPELKKHIDEMLASKKLSSKLFEDLSPEEIEGAELLPYDSTGPEDIFLNKYKLRDGRIVYVNPDGSLLNGDGRRRTWTHVNLSPDEQKGAIQIEYNDDKYSSFFNYYKLSNGKIVRVASDGSISMLNESLSPDEIEGAELLPYDSTGPEDIFLNKYKLRDGRIVYVNPDGSLLNGDGRRRTWTHVNLSPDEQKGAIQIEYNDDKYSSFFNYYKLSNGKIVRVASDGSISMLNESLSPVKGVKGLGTITDVKKAGNSKVDTTSGKDSGVEFNGRTIVAKMKKGSKLGGGKPKQLKTLDSNMQAQKLTASPKVKGVMVLDTQKNGSKPAVKVSGDGPSQSAVKSQNLKLDTKPAGKLHESTTKITERRSKLDEKLSVIIDNLEKEKRADQEIMKKYPFTSILSESDRAEFRILDDTKKQKVAQAIASNPTVDAGIMKGLWESALANVQDTTPLWLKAAPKKYKELYESANDIQKAAINARAEFYSLDTQYKINNFWETSGLDNRPTISLNESVIAKQSDSSDKVVDQFVASIGEQMKRFNR